MPSASAAGAGSIIRQFSTSSSGAIPSVGIDSLGIYKWVTVHVTSAPASARLDFVTANIDSNYATVQLFRARGGGTGSDAFGGAIETSAISTGLWHGPLPGRYFRLGYNTSVGTVTGTIMLSQAGAVPPFGSGTGGTGKLTASTSNQVLSNSGCRSITLKAGRNNTGALYIALNATATATTSIELYAGETISMDIGNLALVNVLGTNATDYLTYMWIG